MRLELQTNYQKDIVPSQVFEHTGAVLMIPKEFRALLYRR